MSKQETQARAKSAATRIMRETMEAGQSRDATTNLLAAELVAFSGKEIEHRIGEMIDTAMSETREQVLIELKDAYVLTHEKSLSNAAIDAVLIGDFETFFNTLR
jgi:hypothetical protein